jgi:prevent-host-death family protein
LDDRNETWTVQDARAHFGDVIDAALRGRPQRVSRRGRETVVVVSEEEWRRVSEPKPAPSFAEHLARFPLSAEEWDEVAPKRHRPRGNPFSET